MRLLVCPQEFKGSLSAPDAATAIAEGARRAAGVTDVRTLPLADGGPGTAAIVAAATGGELVGAEVTGPLGDRIEARYALLPDAGGGPPVALIESAAAAGLVLVPPDLRDPGHATSYGVGELIRNAVDRGARSIVVGVGGTATNEGGAGAAQALGYRLLDRDRNPMAKTLSRWMPPAGSGAVDRNPLPEPAGGIHLLNVFAIDSSGVDRRLADVDLRVAVDVTNELLGEQGATAVYGPQKGVAGELGEMLEDALGRWARTVRHDLGVELTDLPGGGAGGGLAAGLIGVVGGGIESGAALVAEAVGLDEAIEAADLVVTGEGSLDAQTTFGKTVAHVIERCAALGRPCLAVAGSAGGRPDSVADLEVLAGKGVTEAEAMARAAELAADAAERLLRRVVAGGG